MNCEQAQIQMVDYLSGSLSEDGRLEMEAHLSGCESCRAEAEVWRGLDGWPEETPPPAMKVRFLRMLDEHEGRRRWRWEAWWPMRPAFQAAVALLCGLVGWFAGWMPSHQRVTPEIASLQTEMRGLREMVALSLLQQTSASERLRGVSYCSTLDRPDPEVMQALLRTLSLDPSVDVRLAAVDALKRYRAEPAVSKGMIEALSRPQSPLVQISLLDSLGDQFDRAALEVIRRIENDPAAHELVRKRAATVAAQVESGGRL